MSWHPLWKAITRCLIAPRTRNHSNPLDMGGRFAQLRILLGSAKRDFPNDVQMLRKLLTILERGGHPNMVLQYKIRGLFIFAFVQHAWHTLSHKDYEEEGKGWGLIKRFSLLFDSLLPSEGQEDQVKDEEERDHVNEALHKIRRKWMFSSLPKSRRDRDQEIPLEGLKNGHFISSSSSVHSNWEEQERDDDEVMTSSSSWTDDGADRKYKEALDLCRQIRRQFLESPFPPREFAHLLISDFADIFGDSSTLNEDHQDEPFVEVLLGNWSQMGNSGKRALVWTLLLMIPKIRDTSALKTAVRGLANLIKQLLIKKNNKTDWRTETFSWQCYINELLKTSEENLSLFYKTLGGHKHYFDSIKLDKWKGWKSFAELYSLPSSFQDKGDEEGEVELLVPSMSITIRREEYEEEESMEPVRRVVLEV